jgi:glycosyltransferase involved in cell wall biosynthesis
VKVLLVHDYGAPCGGADHLSLGLRDALRRAGHDARLFASSALPVPVANRADYTCFGTVSRVRELLQIANPSALRRLRHVLAEFRPDVTHVCIYATQLSPLILSALRGRPAILHLHNYDQICPTNSKLLPSGALCSFRPGLVCHRQRCVSAPGLARYVAQRGLTDHWRGVFDVVVSPSDWVSRRVRAEGLRVDTTIWNGVPEREARPALGGPPTIAYAGRLVVKKGVDVLLRAMAILAAEAPTVRMLVAGDGPQRPALQRLAAELGLETRVEFLGHLERDSMERVLGAAWVQAVPSVWEEPFGLVAAEAMMRGTATVASRIGGLSELVTDGETGYSVAPGDAPELAKALRLVLKDRALAERLGGAARRWAVAELTEQRCAERFVELYREVVAAHSNRGR